MSPRVGALAVASLVTAAAIAGSSRPARADEADRCATRAEAAQRARLAGRLREARDDLISCASEACPQVVRRDCARWLTEVETELPTVVVHARDGRGQDVADVRVLVDGAKVAERVDGRPIAVDVGEHALRFERAGSAAVTKRIIVASGEHDRIVTVDFPRGPEERPSRVGPLVLGGIGVALAAAGALLWVVGTNEHDDLAGTCAPTGACATSDVDAARGKLIAGDVAVLTGAVAVAGAVTWWLLARPSSDPPRIGAGPALGTFRF